MRTLTTTVYTFAELSEKAQERAIDNYRSKDHYNDFYFDEITETVKKVIDLFNLETGRTYSDIRTGHINDNILQLSGARLMAYIYNNYGSELFAPKYLKHGELIDIKKPFHRMRKQKEITNNCPNKGKISVSYYSNIQKSNSCVLTGCCYDDDILQPVYDFLKTGNAGTTFEDLIKDIENAIEKAYRNTEEWLNSDEFIKEQFQANEYEFTEDGELI